MGKMLPPPPLLLLAALFFAHSRLLFNTGCYWEPNQLAGPIVLDGDNFVARTIERRMVEWKEYKDWPPSLVSGLIS